jgi:hypothetical protein
MDYGPDARACTKTPGDVTARVVSRGMIDRKAPGLTYI